DKRKGRAWLLAVFVVIAAAGCPIGLIEFDEPKTVNVRLDDINLREYLSEPAAGAAPAFAASSFVGIVAWKTDGGAVSGPFQANTAYTAEVSLHSLEGHTFTGAVYRYGEREPSPLPGGTEKRVTLEIDGLQTGEASSGGWPQATEDAPVMVTSLDLTGKVPAPVSGGLPAAALAAGEYIGIVEWEPALSGLFAVNTAYTAAVTLYPLAGFTFEGLPEKPGAEAVTGAFRHDYGELTHGAAGSTLTVTINFPPAANGRVINIDTVKDGDSGPGWSFADKTLTLRASSAYIITGTQNVPTDHRIKVAPYATATVVLRDGVEIDVSAEADACAFDMMGATVNLILEADDTVLKSGEDCAGIQAPAGSTLTIRSGKGAGSTAGTLTVTGGEKGAGIGGGSGGYITIGGSAVVNAVGGNSSASSGAAIGSGKGGSSGNYNNGWGQIGTLILSGGTIIVTKGYYPASIVANTVITGNPVIFAGGTVCSQPSDENSHLSSTPGKRWR
ncbi:MAG: hypothetical protein LBF95_07820, partial [Treponema sp.]|nr:hypothetical protein [Treponema sp.]